MPNQQFTLTDAHHGQTLAAALRVLLAGQSWTQVRRLIEARQVRVGGALCLDPARRGKGGETVEVLGRPDRPPPGADGIGLRHVDEHVVVAEKPSGLNTVRHPAEREWKEHRRALSPTLEDLVTKKLAHAERGDPNASISRLRVVHRLDKETSGLVVFARTVVAERGLGKQFHAHTVHRRYLALVPGYLPPQRIASNLVRDRGDGRRGSTPLPNLGKPAVTHVDVAERLPGYTLLSCRLETGRTHQIRIHLAETGHPVCGDGVYTRLPNGKVFPDHSGAPRLALHAAELGFVHPVSGQSMQWAMPLPADLSALLDRLRAGPAREGGSGRPG